MASRPRKCTKCGQKFCDYKLYKDKVFCEKCLNDYMNTTATCSICNKKIKRKLEFIDKDASPSNKKKLFCSKTCYNKLLQDLLDRDELDKWLKSYHKVDSLNNRIYMQISQFIKKNNFTYKGILLTLQYLVYDLKKELQVDNISIVSWYYDTVKNQYVKKMELQKKVLELQKNDFKMFNVVKTSSSVRRQIDNRKNEILITDIKFN